MSIKTGLLWLSNSSAHMHDSLWRYPGTPWVFRPLQRLITVSVSFRASSYSHLRSCPRLCSLWAIFCVCFFCSIVMWEKMMAKKKKILFSKIVLKSSLLIMCVQQRGNPVSSLSGAASLLFFFIPSPTPFLIFTAWPNVVATPLVLLTDSSSSAALPVIKSRRGLPRWEGGKMCSRCRAPRKSGGRSHQAWRGHWKEKERNVRQSRPPSH